MKLRFALNLLLLLAVSNQHTVQIQWTQSKSPNLIYNTVYCGTKPGGPYTLLKYQSPKPVTHVSRTISGSGTFYCVVTATDSQPLESKFSNETKVIVP